MKKIENHMIIRPYHNEMSRNLKNTDNNINNQKEINLSGGNFNIIIQQQDELNLIEKESKELKELKQLKELKEFGPKLNITSKNIKNKKFGITFDASDKKEDTSIMAIIDNDNLTDLSFITSSKERIHISSDGTIELNGDTIIKGEQTIINSDILGTNNLFINNNITSNGNLIVNSSALINSTLITSKLLIKEDSNKENIEKLDNNYKIDQLNPIIYNQINNENNNKTNKEIGFKIEELQEICPYLVDNNNNINYIGLIGILVNEIKNLKKEINIINNSKNMNHQNHQNHQNNDLFNLEIFSQQNK